MKLQPAWSQQLHCDESPAVHNMVVAASALRRPEQKSLSTGGAGASEGDEELDGAEDTDSDEDALLSAFEDVLAGWATAARLPQRLATSVRFLPPVRGGSVPRNHVVSHTSAWM